jgi:hypothetical protein
MVWLCVTGSHVVLCGVTRQDPSPDCGHDVLPLVEQILTGARQVGKTTLARQLMESYPKAQYLNWDVAADRAVLVRQSWNPRADLVVLDEIHISTTPAW